MDYHRCDNIIKVDSNRYTVDVANCPIRNVLDSLASKWPLLVLHSLSTGKPMYFGELRRSIPDVSPKMLSAALKLLVEEDIITRTVVPEVPPRTLYALTSHGEELLQAIEPLLQWAVNHLRRKEKMEAGLPICLEGG